MWQLFLLRSLIFLFALAMPGVLAPYIPSHGLFLLSGCIYARMILDPSISFAGLALMILMIGDSLAGLRLGSTGYCGLILAFSAFLGQKFWMGCAQKELYAGYACHIFIMMLVYIYIFPIWSSTHVLVVGGISILLFPWVFNGTSRYLHFVAACRHV